MNVNRISVSVFLESLDAVTSIKENALLINCQIILAIRHGNEACLFMEQTLSTLSHSVYLMQGELVRSCVQVVV